MKNISLSEDFKEFLKLLNVHEVEWLQDKVAQASCLSQ